MALADTGKAIGAVTQLLREHLLSPAAVSEADITVGRPEDAATSSPNRKLNLFLFETLFDPSLRNQPLDPGQPIPIWLVLKYLVTAFDTDGNSDSIVAHGLLGEGMRALQELAFLPLIGSASPLNTRAALQDNPEALKITFEQTSSDLLSKVMQGTDEKYRCSFVICLGPVMIMPRQPGTYSLLVGIDYTAAQPENRVIGDAGIQIPVLPAMGPLLTAISPNRIEPLADPASPTAVNPAITIAGQNLGLSDLAVRLGDVELPILAQTPGEIQAEISTEISNGEVISAGSYGLCVVQTLSNGGLRNSNLQVLDLLPLLTDAQYSPSPDPDVQGTLTLTGRLLGTAADDIFVAIYRAGRTVQIFDEVTPILSAVSPQSELQVPIRPGQAVPLTTDRIILRVNAQQAQSSPEVSL